MMLNFVLLVILLIRKKDDVVIKGTGALVNQRKRKMFS
jgi:hypothetical protein